MGVEVTMGVMAAMAVASSAMTMSQASAQKKMAARSYADQIEAARNQSLAQFAEIARQQNEAMEIAQEQKSDRIAKATQELGTLRVLAGEMGTSAGTFSAMVREVGYFEGLDLSRIDANLAKNIEAGEAEKRNAQQGFINTVTIARNQAEVALTDARYKKIGAGIQIASSLASMGNSYYQRKEDRELTAKLLQNTRH